MFTRHYAVWPKELPKTMTLPKTSVFTNLEISALRYPEHTAIIFYDAFITYRRLLAEVEAMAGYLQAQGVKKGDRVLLYMQNSPQYVSGCCGDSGQPHEPGRRTRTLHC